MQSPELHSMIVELGFKSHNGLLEALRGIGVQDYLVTGQKERRIIDTISPVTRRHKLIITDEAVKEDWETCLAHSPDKRTQFSALYQLGNITYDRGSLVHDDRADAVEAVVRLLQGFLAIDDEKASEVRKEAEFQEFLRNPMGKPKWAVGINRERSGGRGRPRTSTSRYRR